MGALLVPDDNLIGSPGRLRTMGVRRFDSINRLALGVGAFVMALAFGAVESSGAGAAGPCHPSHGRRREGPHRHGPCTVQDRTGSRQRIFPANPQRRSFRRQDQRRLHLLRRQRLSLSDGLGREPDVLPPSQPAGVCLEPARRPPVHLGADPLDRHLRKRARAASTSSSAARDPSTSPRKSH